MNAEPKLQRLFDLTKKSNAGKRTKIRFKKLGSGNYSIYFDIYYQGSRQYQFMDSYLTPGDPVHNDNLIRTIIAIRDKQELDLLQGKHGISIDNWKGKSSFIDYYIKKAPKEARNYNAALLHFKRYLDGKDISFNKLNRDVFVGFMEYLQSKVSTNTVWAYLAKMKTILNQAVKDEIIDKSPAQFVTAKKKETKREYLTMDEVNLLANTECVSPVLKDAFLFSVFTGLRLSDVTKLTWSDIRGNRMYLRQQKTDEILESELSETAQDILSRQDHSHSKVFHHMPDKTSIGRYLKRWTQDAGISKHITFHCARHTCATLLITYGSDLYTVSKVLGHKDIATTQIYAKLVDSKKSEALNSIPKIEMDNTEETKQQAKDSEVK